MPDKLEKNYFGMNMIWWFGVVEDRNDPIKLGRVRVRCNTWHTEDKILLPTESLPWAQCIQPVTSAAISGIGRSPTGLVEGSWVFGFFMDGKDAQKPMVMGSLAGLSTEEPDKEIGFNDPNEIFPLNEDSEPHPSQHDVKEKFHALNEPDVDRLARNDKREDPDTELISPILAKKAAGLSLGNIVPKIISGDDFDTLTWDEQASKYNAKYANNHVTRTESGHVFEVDDTPSNERIHEYHKSGTFKEIAASGNTVTRIVGDNYTVVAGNDFIKIKGSTNVTIDGNCNMYVAGNYNLLVDGNKNEVIKGNKTEKIHGRYDSDVQGEYDLEANIIHLNKTEKYASGGDGGLGDST